ncbi:MAG: hypothetical protein GY772_02730 [bacterium]|nr:hypothetical protein [bacterium]
MGADLVGERYSKGVHLVDNELLDYGSVLHVGRRLTAGRLHTLANHPVRGGRRLGVGVPRTSIAAGALSHGVDGQAFDTAASQVSLLAIARRVRRHCGDGRPDLRNNLCAYADRRGRGV